jgi:LacI family transcriptional regulator
MTQNPTLQDVAAAAGVSTATVSRCLNFPDKVAERTRSKVMQAVKVLSYSPNFGARAMAARRTNTIGAIIPTMENAVFARGLQSFQDELREYGFTMLVASTSYRPEVEEEQIRALVARGADALLLIGHERSPEVYQFLDVQRIPTLVTWAFDGQSPRPSIGFDNRKAMRLMALHFC